MFDPTVADVLHAVNPSWPGTVRRWDDPADTLKLTDPYWQVWTEHTVPTMLEIAGVDEAEALGGWLIYRRVSVLLGHPVGDLR